MEETIIEYNGYTFIRYPESDRVSDQRYFRRWCKLNGVRAKRYLHRYKWQCEKGPIPKGYHVHHSDSDFLNNDINNFELKTPSDHIKHHYELKSEESKAENVRQLREAYDNGGRQWHSTPDGIAQKKANYKFLFFDTPVARICPNCKVEFETTRRVKQYCTDKCKRRKVSRDSYHRRVANGKYIPLKLRKLQVA